MSAFNYSRTAALHLPVSSVYLSTLTFQNIKNDFLFKGPVQLNRYTVAAQTALDLERFLESLCLWVFCHHPNTLRVKLTQMDFSELWETQTKTQSSRPGWKQTFYKSENFWNVKGLSASIFSLNWCSVISDKLSLYSCKFNIFLLILKERTCSTFTVVT